MAIHDRVLTNYGVYDISGGTLKTAVDAINIDEEERLSGANLKIIHVGLGQVLVLKEGVAST